jgi:hypothetical protein
MSREQLERSIELGEQILSGEANLVELDERSLVSRGKVGKGKGMDKGRKIQAERLAGVDEGREKGSGKRKLQKDGISDKIPVKRSKRRHVRGNEVSTELDAK